MTDNKVIFIVFSNSFGNTRHIITTPEHEQEVIDKYKKMNEDLLCEENYERTEISDPQLEVNVHCTPVTIDSNVEDMYKFPEDRLEDILS